MSLLYTFTVAFAFIFSLVQGVPFNIKPRAVAADLLAELAFIEQYAAAAYCPSNNVPASSTLITCSAGNCPEVQSAGANSLVEFQNVGPTDTQGYVAIDRTNNLIVISFRGSVSAANWIGNLDFVAQPWLICAGCTVHMGFYNSWISAKSLVQTALAVGIQECPSCKIIATGHSLGAAIATIAAADLRSQGHAVTLYNYGSPMVGNALLARFITSQPGGNYRVTHADDLVPKLPGYLLGFAHISPEYWITSGDNVTVTAQDIQVSSGVYDLQGNAGTSSSSTDAHLWYFNSIAACSS